MSTSLSLLGPNGLGIAHETIDLMGRYEVPPNAQNYEVWLNFKVGAHPDLRTRIEGHIASNLRFTAEVNEKLYQDYFASVRASAQMLDASDRLAQEIAGLVSTLASAGDRAGVYGGALDTAIQRLERGIDAQGLHDLVSGLTTATRQIADSNAVLTERLKESSRELETMRATLQAARAEAMTDGLTGLSNRKAFDDSLRFRLKEAAAQRSDICLVLLDIDHFKKFNDTWGHQTGDQIIRFIASSLQRHTQSEHTAARYGGEEFAIIMPRTRLTEARSIAEALRVAIESKKLLRKSTGEDLGRTTISIGIAQWRAGETDEQLIERADACLYASKNAGRNRVTTDFDMARSSAA